MSLKCVSPHPSTSFMIVPWVRCMIFPTIIHFATFNLIYSFFLGSLLIPFVVSSFLLMTSSKYGRLNNGQAYLRGCTFVQWNIGSWQGPVCVLTCRNKCSSQTRVLISLQQHATLYFFVVVKCHPSFFAEHIVKTLEIFSVQLQVDYEWVFKAILSIGISLSAVLEVYHK